MVRFAALHTPYQTRAGTKALPRPVGATVPEPMHLKIQNPGIEGARRHQSSGEASNNSRPLVRSAFAYFCRAWQKGCAPS